MPRLLLLLAIALTLSACTTTRYIPAESVRTEYRDRATHSVDTVADTQLVYINGDTVLIYRDRWRTSQLHDTVTVATHDTIAQPYPVPAELSTWERTKINLGGYALALATLALLLLILRIATTLRPTAPSAVNPATPTPIHHPKRIAAHPTPPSTTLRPLNHRHPSTSAVNHPSKQ